MFRQVGAEAVGKRHQEHGNLPIESVGSFDTRIAVQAILGGKARGDIVNMTELRVVAESGIDPQILPDIAFIDEIGAA